MSDKDSDILREIKSKLSAISAESRVILFGSRARGDADSDSDMDVLVLVKGEIQPGDEERISEVTWEIGLKYGRVISPIAVSQRQWEEGLLASSLLKIAVAREGIEV